LPSNQALREHTQPSGDDRPHELSGQFVRLDGVVVAYDDTTLVYTSNQTPSGMFRSEDQAPASDVVVEMGYLATIGLLVGACSSSTDAPVTNHATPVAASGCIPASEPADVVVQISRTTLPIAGDRTEEHGAVTHGGSCPANVACKKVDNATMSTIWTDLARAATIDHGPPSSPHYGGRWLEASWTGGSCAIADSQEAPVTSASAPRFDAAYDAVAKPFN
jgi:hypothetical protein